MAALVRDEVSWDLADSLDGQGENPSHFLGSGLLPEECEAYNGPRASLWCLVHPFLTVGYGSYSANLKDIAKDSNRAINLGVGVELQLGDKFSLMAEGKYHNVKVDIEGEELSLKNYTLSGGFNIYF